MNRATLASLGAIMLASAASAEDQAAAPVRDVSPEFERRMAEAAAGMAAMRERVAREKAPLAEAMRRLEDEIFSLQAEIAQLEGARAADGERRLEADARWDLAQRNVGYMNKVLQESLQGLRQSLRAGEDAGLAVEIDRLQDRLGHAKSADAGPAWDGVHLLFEHVRLSLGGYAVDGQAVLSGTNRLVSGRLAHFGPETFFLSQDGAAAGTLHRSPGSPYPVLRVLAGWSRDEAAAFVQGRPGAVVLDGSGGKAVQLAAARGTVAEHIRKGGIVGYLIIALGLLAVVISVLKLVELRQLAVDPPEQAGRLIAALASGAEDEAKSALAGMRRTTRELCAAGMRYWGQPKEVLQDHLHAVILQERLHFQRRLPMLAVIVTAAPLLGLLGTVTGMIKTFTLIMVYGTGNAARLSSGISEALVTTELGLVVAIPALVVHGYFSHRARRSLAALERCSHQLATAAEEAREARRPSPERA